MAGESSLHLDDRNVVCDCWSALSTPQQTVTRLALQYLDEYSLSILATVMKAASLAVLNEGISQMKWLWFRNSRRAQHLAWYDSATRSIWGRIRLMITLRWRDAIATIGAITALLGIAIDPFT